MSTINTVSLSITPEKRGYKVNIFLISAQKHVVGSHKKPGMSNIKFPHCFLSLSFLVTTNFSAS